MADSELRMANVEAQSSEESGVEFFDRWALIVLRHKVLYLLIAVAVAGGYVAKEFLTARPCRTSWLMRSGADPAAMQAVSAALGSSATIIKKGNGLIQITTWGPAKTCGLGTVVRVVTELRRDFQVTIDDMVGESTTDYNRRRAGPVVGRAALAAIVVVGLLAFMADAVQRGWRHMKKLNGIANGE